LTRAKKFFIFCVEKVLLFSKFKVEANYDEKVNSFIAFGSVSFWFGFRWRNGEDKGKGH
jgi:hypothetical protein